VWTWDADKDEANRRRHGFNLGIAEVVFEDPLVTTTEDPYPYESRWQTLGVVAGTLILVVHTRPEPDSATGMLTGRIISVRRATPHERRAYEEG
jgi:uncharacterized DUF497 family protein